MGYIYIIKNNQNEMKYVGQTIREVKLRFSEHKSAKGRRLSEDIKKIGISNFSIMEIREVDNDKLDEEEQLCIVKYNTIYPNGYNNIVSVQGLNTEYNSIGGKSVIGHEKQSKKVKEKYSTNPKLKDLGEVPIGISYYREVKKNKEYEGFKVRKLGIKPKRYSSLSSVNKLKENLELAKNYLSAQLIAITNK